jgi:parallel beta-helix repeat protein
MTKQRAFMFVLVMTTLGIGLGMLYASQATATSGDLSITTDTILTEDHNGTITIDADNVTLDCAGFTIMGPGAAVAILPGITIRDRTNVTVKNCVVTESKDGFSIRNSTAIDLIDNVAVINRGSGFRIAESSSAVTVTGSSADQNDASGFFFLGVSDITSTDNTASTNASSGFRIEDSSNSDFLRSSATDNSQFGFSVAGSTGITLEANTASGGRFGFDLATSDANVVRANRTTGTGRGFTVSESSNNLFADNVSNDGGGDGFKMVGTSVGNTFSGNQAHRNRGRGFLDPTTGTGTSGTGNFYNANSCTGNTDGGSNPTGLCQEEPVALVDTTQGKWYLRHDADNVTSFYYGNPGDIPFMGDWDCDGEATPGLFRTSDAFAYLRNSNSQGNANIRFFFGNPSDIPLAGDFNGDGCDTLSIYRPSEARFYIVNELGENDGGLGPAEYSFLFGDIGDKPVVGDWDGDGVDEIGLHREATGLFYWRNTLDTGIADGTIFFGDPGDRFVAGDWGIVDGKDTPAVFRPSNAMFYFRFTLTEGIADTQYAFGESGWLPVAGSFG